MHTFLSHLTLSIVLLLGGCAGRSAAAEGGALTGYDVEVLGCPSSLSITLPPGFAPAPYASRERRQALLQSLIGNGYSEVFLLDWSRDDSPQIRVGRLTSLMQRQGLISSEEWRLMRQEFVKFFEARIKEVMGAESLRGEAASQGSIQSVDAEFNTFREMPDGSIAMVGRAAAIVDGRARTATIGTKLSHARGCVVQIFVASEADKTDGSQRMEEWLNSITIM